MENIMVNRIAGFVLIMSLISVAACMQEAGTPSTELLEEWSRQLRAGDLRTAEETSFALLEAVEREKGKESAEYAGALNRVALTTQAQGRYGEAIEWFGKELELNRILTGPNHPDVALALSNIGHCLLLSGEYSAALDTARKSLEIYERIRSQLKDEEGYVKAHYLLATAYYETGRYEEAEVLLRKILNTSYMQQVQDTNQVVTILVSTAGCELQKGNVLRADTLARRAFALTRKAFSSWSMQMAEVLGIMGQILNEAKEYESSEESFLLSLRVRDSLGRVDEYYALTLNHLSTLYIRTEDYNRADSVLDRALALYKSLGGTNSVPMAWIYRNKSSVAVAQGRLADAERYKLQALRIYEDNPGLHSTLSLEVLESLLDLYLKTGRKQEAGVVEARIRQIKEQNMAL